VCSSDLVNIGESAFDLEVREWRKRS